MSRVSGAVIDLAVALLPQQVRRRYRDEFEADLQTLPRRERWAYAASILVGAPRLRWETLRVLSGRAAPWCFLRLHRDRTFRPNSDDPSILAKECRRCHRLRDPKQFAARQRRGELEWAPAAFYR